MQFVFVMNVPATDRPAPIIADAMKVAAVRVQTMYPLVEGRIKDDHGTTICEWKIGEYDGL